MVEFTGIKPNRHPVGLPAGHWHKRDPEKSEAKLRTYECPPCKYFHKTPQG